MKLTEKYRPKTLDDFVNQKKQIDQIKIWVGKILRGLKVKPLLLTGPPGTGKTSMAHAIANQYNFELIEINASDYRRREDIKNIVESAASRGFSGKRVLILIDEVDGFTTLESSGIYELEKILKNPPNPIILTCNDPFEKSVLRLKPYCEVIEFKRLTATDLYYFGKKILEKEGVKFEEDALKLLATKEEGDVRSFLNDLEVLIPKGYITKKDIELLGLRDREVDVFEFLKRLFKSPKMLQPWVVTSGVEIDRDILMYWIDENISREYEKPEEIEKAYYYLSLADVYEGRIIKTQAWELLVYSSIFSISGVQCAKEKVYRKFTKYHYPQILRDLKNLKEVREKKKSALKKLIKIFHCSKSELIQTLDILKEYFQKNQNALIYLIYKANLEPEEISALFGVSQLKAEELYKEARKIKRETHKIEIEIKEPKKAEEKEDKQKTLF